MVFLGLGSRAGEGWVNVLVHSFVSGWHCSSVKWQRIWPMQLTAQSHSNRLHQWNALAGLKVDCRETSWMGEKKAIFELVFPFMGWKFPSQQYRSYWPLWFSSPRNGERKVKVLVSQSCPTFCNLMDWSLPGSAVPGILQARTLEWVAITFSKGSSWPRDGTQVSCIAGRFFTIWATSEAQEMEKPGQICGGKPDLGG